MSNKTKDILDEVLDVAESTTELVEKKPDTLKNWLLVKDPQFLSNPHETW